MKKGEGGTLTQPKNDFYNTVERVFFGSGYFSEFS